jgi:hypothetical protein
LLFGQPTASVKATSEVALLKTSGVFPTGIFLASAS